MKRNLQIVGVFLLFYFFIFTGIGQTPSDTLIYVSVEIDNPPMNVGAENITPDVLSNVPVEICAPPTNVRVDNIGPNSADLLFSSSGVHEDSISYSTNFYRGLGATTAADFQVAHRYTSTELSSHNGKYLTKVSFIPTTTACTYSLRVWTGGTSSNPGTLVVEQVLVTSDLTMNAWNEVVLSTPVLINSSQELWIGYRCVTTQANARAAGYDQGPMVSNKGNMIYWNGSWTRLNLLSGILTYNWCIKGFLTSQMYNMEYGLSGFAQNTGTMISTPLTIVDNMDNLVPISGLNSNTAYDCYLQRNCGGGTYSSWVGPVSFTTPIDSLWCKETFEGFELGNHVAAQSPNIFWTTWSSTPGSSEDAVVTNEYVFQGDKAAKLVYGNDLVALLGDKTSGTLVVEYSMYIPTGKNAYANMLHEFAAGSSEYANELYFNQNGYSPGSGTLYLNNQTYSFSYPQDKWFLVKYDINLNTDQVTLTINGNSIRTWQFSYQARRSTPGQKKLAAISFWPPTSTSRSLFYVDNVNIAQPGTFENPLTIDNVQELQDFRTAVNQNGTYQNIPATSGSISGFGGKYFVITADLDLSSVCGPNINGSEIDWIPIGNTTYPFKGHLNALHHVISNLYINDPSSNNQGLFGILNGADIDSLHLENGFVKGGANVGALCGTATNSTQISSVTSGLVVQGSDNIGGITGVAQTSNVAYSTNSGSVIASIRNVGGIIGKTENSTVNYSINAGIMIAPTAVGGIVGSLEGATSAVNYALNTGMIIGQDEFMGAISGKKVSNPTVSNCYYDKQIFTASSDGTGLFTTEITGTGLQGNLGNSSDWLFSADLYPRVATTANHQVSLLAAAPFFLSQDSTGFETLELVLEDFTVSTDNGIQWTSVNTSSLSITQNQATINCIPSIDTTQFIAQIDQMEKEFFLINKKLSYSVADTVIICSSQLPYLYNDSVLIESAIDTMVTYQTVYGCDSLISLTVIVHSNPVLTVSQDTTICFGTDVLLQAQTDAQTDTYLWSTSDTTTSVTLTAVENPQTLSVVVSRDYEGLICMAYDTVEVLINPVYNHYDTVSVCYTLLPYEYDNSGAFFTDSGWQAPISLQTAEGCDSVMNVYMIVFYDVYSNDTLVICRNQLPIYYGDSLFTEEATDGDYAIIFENNTGCDSIVSLHLVVLPIPSVTDLIGDDRIFLGDTVDLTVQTSDHFQWSTGDTANSITVIPTLPGANDYMVYLLNNLGCVDTFVHTIMVETCGAGYPAADLESNTYSTNFYGRTCWMTENLRATLYSDGQPISGAMDYHSSVYPDSVYNVSVFGRLYNWYSATRAGNFMPLTLDNSIQGVCPEGWRLPTHAEYLSLMMDFGYRLADLKSNHYWLDNSGNNSSQFSWLPAGFYNANAGQYMNLYGNGYFITTTTVTNTHFESFSCGYNCPELQREVADKNNGYSVRCVKTVD